LLEHAVKPWILFVPLAFLSLSACSSNEEPVATGTASSPVVNTAIAANVANTGSIQQLLQAAGYTYAEVKTHAGQTLWMAGTPLQLQVGDAVEWGDYAVMRNFSSKALGRTFQQILFVNAWGPLGSVARPAATQLAQDLKPAPARADGPMDSAQSGRGRVMNVAYGGGYTYLEIEHDHASLWLAAPQASVQVGEQIAWNNGALMQNFAANSLGRTFDRIIFVGTITVVQ
jgi:hypothetical protein